MIRFVVSILFLLVCSPAVAQVFPSVGTLDADSSRTIVDAYSERVSRWEENQERLNEIVATSDNGLIDEASLGADGYEEYQSLLQEQETLVAEATQIVEHSRNDYTGLPDGANSTIVDEYNALVREYDEVFIRNIDNPSAASRQRLVLVQDRLQRYQDFHDNDDNTPAVSSSGADRDSAGGITDGGGDLNVSNMAAYQFLDRMSKQLIRVVRDVIFDDLAQVLRTPFTIMLTLWLMFVAVSMVRGVQVVPMDMAMKFGLILIISTLTFSGGGAVFFDWVFHPVYNTFFSLAAFILDTTTYGAASAMTSDVVSNKHFAGVVIVEERLKDALSWGALIFEAETESIIDVSGAVKGAGLYLITVGAFLLLWITFSGLMAYSVFASMVLFAMSPLMMIFYVFKTTKGITISWVRGLFNYLMIPVIAAFSMGLTLNILMQSWMDFEAIMTQIEGGADIDFPKKDLYALLLMTLLSFLIHMRIPDITASITGGSSHGLGNTVANSMTAVSTGVMAAATLGATTKKGREAWKKGYTSLRARGINKLTKGNDDG